MKCGAWREERFTGIDTFILSSGRRRKNQQIRVDENYE
jgi:hypothetical protein